MTHGLGRRFAPDDRDFEYPIRTAFPDVVDRPYRYWWDNGWWGDQGQTPRCVAFSGVKYLEDGPVTYDGRRPDPGALYGVLQRNDEWPGEGYEGTSVRAVGRVLSSVELCAEAGIEAGRPLIQSYRWAFDEVEAAIALLTVGPLILGTNWYWSMNDTDDSGFVHIGPESDIAGGHAYLATGVRIVLAEKGNLNDPATWNYQSSAVRCCNSWGRAWGDQGRFWLTLSTLARLIHEEGEALIAIEEPTPDRPGPRPIEDAVPKAPAQV